MLILDKMLVGGVRFVLHKLVAAVDQELNDDGHLREQLLAAQMRLELGELSEEEFADIEREVLARLRELRERREGPQTGDLQITGLEAELTWDAPAVEKPKPSRRRR